ncbi:MAG: Tad domain-containing protein [Pirellulales bacterium]|nr:Tad domain-containing protein [Pirellulales bacterium]
MLFLAMLLGMVMNAGRHVDDKIRMQNAADAAAQSGGVMVARGMNGLAFTNHLLFDVFAMTAFMREARDRNAGAYVPEILDAWAAEAPKFAGAPIEKFQRLGPAIAAKAPREAELARRWSDWAAATSELVLPVMEEILQQRMIPEFQRTLVAAIPDMAQAATAEVAARHTGPAPSRGPMLGVLWRGAAVPVGNESDALARTLPVIDPVMDYVANQAQFFDRARDERRDQSRRHLDEWNYRALLFFDREAKMGQFGRLWRHFTCAQLEHLLEVEYPTTNLPHVIRTEQAEVHDGNAHLDEAFSFVAVVYWPKTPEILPGLFRDPIDGDAVAYAQARLFIPARRLVWHWAEPAAPPFGDMGGHEIPMPPPEDGSDPGDEEPTEPGHWIIAWGPGISEQWNLLNQNWTAQLVPATLVTLPAILQTPPDAAHRPPSLGGMTVEDIQRISPH